MNMINNIKKYLLLALSFTALCSQQSQASADPYPKNPDIDALNYRFEIELSDDTDEILASSTMDVRFLAEGIKRLRLDLIKRSAALENKGMSVTAVTSDGKPVSYTHEDDALWITLPTPSGKNQRSQFTIIYHGIPATGLIIGQNKYGDRSVTGERNERWRNVIIHEIAHQWFGNSVTEYDWDDVWLSEGFATYFTLLFIEHEYGRDAFLAGLRSSKQRVDAFHQDHPDYRIVHDNLQDMSQVTSSHTYQKGSWVLHMLRGVIGTDNFWKGIRSYYHKYRNANATTDDFRREMEEASGKDLEVFFRQWLYRPGALQCSGNWQYDRRKGRLQIRLDQVQDDGRLFDMPLEIGIYFEGQDQPLLTVVQLTERSNVFTIELETAPHKVVLDPNLWILMDVENFAQQEE